MRISNITDSITKPITDTHITMNIEAQTVSLHMIGTDARIIMNYAELCTLVADLADAKYRLSGL